MERECLAKIKASWIFEGARCTSRNWSTCLRSILTGDEAREGPVDPAADDDHGQDVRQVPLEHVGHHGRVCHGVLHHWRPLGGLEVPGLLVVEEVLTHQEALRVATKRAIRQDDCPGSHG